MFELCINEQTLILEGKIYTANDIRNKVLEFPNGDDFYNDLFLFLQEWFSDSSFINVFTSGSTGSPKHILVEKQKMIQSAVLTCDFLKLKVHDTALLCMPLKYIAAKMLVVRVLVAKLNLFVVKPDGHPLRNLDMSFDFVPMIPLQVFNSLQDSIESRRLKSIKKLIIGGGAIDKKLANDLKAFPNKIFSTYGMTETLSHIALRRLNGNTISEYYKPFDSVNLELAADNSLIIHAPLVSDDIIYTNDIVQFNSKGEFKILGRKDNIINTGGVKVQIEEVESQLRNFISGNYVIIGQVDSKFGEIVVLVIEKDTIINVDLQQINLPKYASPKSIIKVDYIPLTETGKVNRPELKKILNKLTK